MKSHLISSDTQLVEGKTYTALCGKEVPRAKWVFFAVDAGRMHNFVVSFDPLRDCKDCWFGREIPDGLIYGMIEGEQTEGEA